MLRPVTVLALLLFSASALQAEREFPQLKKIDDKMELHKVCHHIFTTSEESRIYRRCSAAQKQGSYASAAAGFKYSFWSLGTIVTIIGLIPFAQDTRNFGLLAAGGVIIALGFVAILPEAYFRARSRTKKREAIDMYNAYVDKKRSGSSHIARPTSVGLVFNHRF